MNDYFQFLDTMYSSRTFKRKLCYIKYNFGRYLGPNKKALEIGPGMGEFITELSRQGTTTVDVVECDQRVMQHITKNHAVRRTWNVALENLESIAPELDRYDIIMCSQVLEHVRPEALCSVLRTLYASLVAGGVLIVVVPNGSNPLNMINLYNDLTHRGLFTERSLRQLAAMSEIPATSVKVTAYRIPPSTPLNLLRIVAQKILHLFLLLMLFANGGDYSMLLHPNLCLVIRRPQD